MTAGALTVVAPVRPERLAALRGLLRELGGGADASPVPFGDVPSLHFARWALLPPPPGGGPTQLAFESNFEGPAEAHLAELIEALGAHLARVYDHCAGFAAGGPRPAAALAGYLRRRALREAAFYVGVPGLTRALAENDRLVRRALDRAADELVRRGAVPRDPEDARRALLAALEEARDLTLGPADEVAPAPKRALLAAALAAGGAALLPALPVALPAALALALALRWHEARDAARPPAAPPPGEADDERLDELARREGAHAQSPLTHLVPVKEGLLRAFAVRASLAAIGLLGRHLYTQGRLGKLSSIHFARWVLLPDRRLLFFSNYDGSWESYLGDFVDKQSAGLTAIWSNTEGFPPASWLVRGGAKDEEAFKLWVRRHELPTPVWYSAYPSLTLPDLLRNARLRAGAVDGGPPGAPAWLAEL
ncbi:MAG TPA: hypothetical protein VFS00_06240 [Polyangiaceae bacterium]|nr:hypothetical protein [Polyangiaceae bacterium]